MLAILDFYTANPRKISIKPLCLITISGTVIIGTGRQLETGGLPYAIQRAPIYNPSG